MLSLYSKVENAKNKKLPIQQKIDSLKTIERKSEDGKTGMVPMLSVLLPERFSLNNFSQGLAPSAPN